MDESAHSDTSESSSEDNYICERCSKIPFEAFLLPPGQRPEEIEAPRGGIDALERDTACYVCTFFKSATFNHRAAECHRDFENQPIRLVCCDDEDNITNTTSRYVNLNDGSDLILGKFVIALQGSSEMPYWFSEMVDFDLLKSWISECSLQHQDTSCSSDPVTVFRLTVIDCQQRRVVSAPSDCQFVALSYVWGGSHNQFEDLPDSHNDFNLPSKLPQVIEDSIIVALKLGFKYLWVDRYCINQKDGEGKKIQIHQMGAVYASAQVTIIAACGYGARYGLPGVQAQRQLYSVKVGNVQLIRIPRHDELHPREILESKWASRAWTFQEGMLSKKRLFFTDNQVLYACDFGIGYDFHVSRQFAPYKLMTPLYDDFFEGILPPFRQFELDMHCLHEYLDLPLWYLQKYCRRDLTYDVDALNAIAGALNSLRNKIPPMYHIYGVPFDISLKTWLLERFSEKTFGLVTSVPRNKLTLGDIGFFWYHARPCRRRSGHPSWSPLGWNGEIYWHQMFNQSIKHNPKAQYFRYGARGQAKDLMHYVHERNKDLVLPSQFLEIDGLAVLLSIVQIEDPKVPRKHLWAVALACGTYFKIVLRVVWDIQPDSLTRADFIQGVLPRPGWEHCSPPFDDGGEILLIVRETTTDLYERIGLARIPPKLRSNTSFFCDDPDISVLNKREVQSAIRDGMERRLRVWGPRVFQQTTIVLE